LFSLLFLLLRFLVRGYWRISLSLSLSLSLSVSPWERRDDDDGGEKLMRNKRQVRENKKTVRRKTWERGQGTEEGGPSLCFAKKGEIN
jgi:hypothetical protein